ncbi:MAG TPA: hypothetical protein VNO21_10170 [Polyangiaceae bacterium]|nr:hypothetical protein [Polyangiaceae bacterium]
MFFRGKIEEIVRASGGAITRDEPCDLVVVELGKAGVQDRIRGLVERGVAVLAFGSHVNAEQLRDARTAGARAVPNSEIELALRGQLES